MGSSALALRMIEGIISVVYWASCIYLLGSACFTVHEVRDDEQCWAVGLSQVLLDYI
jgi:hypothetical protein